MDSASGETSSAPASQTQVQIKLFTRHLDLAVPDVPLLVPTSLRRYGLSQVVNHLLETSKPTPFDFLIDGSFLRTSLDDYLTQNGLSSESTITLEYVRSVLPPVHLASFEHDDWVSSVATISASTTSETQKAGEFLTPGQSRILSGSFDGIARVWNLSGQVLGQAAGHTASIKTVGWVAQKRFLTGSIDRTVRLWGYEEPEGGDVGSVTPIAEYHGHKSTVNTLAINSSTNQFLTASNDGTVGLWSTNPNSSPPAPAIPQPTTRQSKKRKTASSNLPQLGPLLVLAQPSNATSTYSQPVSQAIFHPQDPQFAYSATWSHTILTHDLTTSICIDTRTTAHPLLSLTALPSLGLLAAGSSSRNITLHDPRANAATVSQATLRGHTNSVVSLCAAPQSEFLMVSASHDGFLRVWDVRAAGGDKEGAGSLYTIKRDGAGESGSNGKVFGVEWSAGVGIVSAGEDKKVQVNTGVSVAGDGGDLVTSLGGK